MLSLQQEAAVRRDAPMLPLRLRQPLAGTTLRQAPLPINRTGVFIFDAGRMAQRIGGHREASIDGSQITTFNFALRG